MPHLRRPPHSIFTQGIAFERLSTLLSDLLGLDISEGALVNILDAARACFAAATAAIRARLLGGTILQSDETGLRVGKQNWWLWVFHHDDSALFVAAPSRAKKVVADFLGDFRPDFWVSDRYGGQMGWASVNNQVCLAHLIRDVQYAIDAGDDIFAPELRHLLGRACRIGRRRQRLADATMKTYAARLHARLDELIRLAPAHEAGVKLQRMIKRTRQYLFVFVTNRDIPATNNGSERALRPCAVFRKITNGFRTEWGPSSTPTSAPSSRPHAAAPSEPSKQSASPSPVRHSQIQHSRRLSNYVKRCRGSATASTTKNGRSGHDAKTQMGRKPPVPF